MNSDTGSTTTPPPGPPARPPPPRAPPPHPKPPPPTPTEPEWRTRTDKVDSAGKVSLRYAGRLRHLGIGRAHAGTPILMLIRDHEVITSNPTTGEVLAEHHLDPAKDYQRPKR